MPTVESTITVSMPDEGASLSEEALALWRRWAAARDLRKMRRRPPNLSPGDSVAGVQPIAGRLPPGQGKFEGEWYRAGWSMLSRHRGGGIEAPPCGPGATRRAKSTLNLCQAGRAGGRFERTSKRYGHYLINA